MNSIYYCVLYIRLKISLYIKLLRSRSANIFLFFKALFFNLSSVLLLVYIYNNNTRLLFILLIPLFTTSIAKLYTTRRPWNQKRSIYIFNNFLSISILSIFKQSRITNPDAKNALNIKN